MTSTLTSEVQPLTKDAIHALLARNRVGRLAYSRGTVIDLEPVYYVYSEGWIYGRTSPEVRVGTDRESWWPVAFQVDEVDGRCDWRSVVVRGGFYTLSGDASAWERSEYEHAVHLLRGVDTEPGSPRWRREEGGVVFRIAVQEASGRRMTKTRDENEPLVASAKN
jgi:uncharacterized protein